MMKLMKQHKWQILLSSIAVLLPVVVGVFFWNDLPQTMTTHWGADGAADGWMDKAYAIVSLPLMLWAVHLICLLITLNDPKNKNQNTKILGIMFWVVPIISWFANAIMYGAALDQELDMNAMPLFMICVVFVVLGNYMPKCKQNSTIGVKVKWALADEENWNATHRFAGKLWVVGGLLTMACGLLPLNLFVNVFTVMMLLMAFVPMLYSYFYYRKQAAEGKVPEKAILPIAKWQQVSSAAIVTVIVVGVLVVMFTGSIKMKYEETSFTIDATYWNDLTVDYDMVNTIAYEEEFDAGVRTNGWGSARLCMGTFTNDEFGVYTLYAYTNGDGAVVMEVDGSVLVLVGKDETATKEMYLELSERIK